MAGKDVDAFVEIDDVGLSKDPAAMEAEIDLGGFHCHCQSTGLHNM